MTVIKLSISPIVSLHRFVNTSSGWKIVFETAAGRIGFSVNITNEQVKLSDVFPMAILLLPDIKVENMN